MSKLMKEFASVGMLIILTVGIALFYSCVMSEQYKELPPEKLEEYNRFVAYHQSLPISQMTGEKVGYYDENFNYILFDRTKDAR